MSKIMKEKIQVKIVEEILGTPKEHVEETMKKVIEKLKNEQGVKVLKETIREAYHDKIMWHVFSDLEIEVEDFKILANLCFDYMPTSIKTLNERADSRTKDIINILNKLLIRLHKVDQSFFKKK